ncbi:phosphoglucomutase, partial [Candidatus Hakubella thermalkaliphila]
IHDHRDVLFGGGLPDPSEQNLGDLKVKMKEVGADIGVSLDGDGDRFGVIDSRGVYLKPNELIALFLYYLTAIKGFKKGKAVRTVATTHFIDARARDLGIQVEETPVGFKYICEKMLEDGVIIGGEESGGLSVQGHIPEKDGILADLWPLK